MARTFLLVAVAVIAIAAALIWQRQLRDDSVPRPAAEVSPLAEVLEPDAAASPVVEPSPVESVVASPEEKSPLKRRERPLRSAFPTLKQFREEVEQNPHGVPLALRRFSTVMGARMERAIRDEQAARELIPELEECVARSEVNAARQVCLINSRRLGKKYPSLAGDSAKVDQAASAELRATVESLGLD